MRGGGAHCLRQEAESTPPSHIRPGKKRAIKSKALLLVTYVGLLQPEDCSEENLGLNEDFRGPRTFPEHHIWASTHLTGERKAREHICLNATGHNLLQNSRLKSALAVSSVTNPQTGLGFVAIPAPHKPPFSLVGNTAKDCLGMTMNHTGTVCPLSDSRGPRRHQLCGELPSPHCLHSSQAQEARAFPLLFP